MPSVSETVNIRAGYQIHVYWTPLFSPTLCHYSHYIKLNSYFNIGPESKNDDRIDSV